VSGYTVRRSWQVFVHDRFEAYVAEATPKRVECLRGVIRKLQHGDIDLIKIPFDADPSAYAIWACDVIIVAATRLAYGTVGLIDVIEPAADSL
jgi:hypothetical protein